MKSFVKIFFISLLYIGINGIPTPEKADSATSNIDNLEDDSDMLMEPNDFQPSLIASPDQQQYYQPQEFRPIVPVTPDLEFLDRSSSQGLSLDPQAQAAQNFLPSYFRDAQPLGHSRPYYTPDRYTSNRAYDQSILGSGDFGVIRGGTFYQDNDPPARGLETNDYYSFYKNNGHGRPQASPYTQSKYNGYGEEQFSNFRDFADINTPADPAYSHFVVVYANKNATVPSEHPNPKNIFEQLQLIDQEAVDEKQKKNSISTIKKKLKVTKLEKKYKKTLGPKDNDMEPLLALS